MTRLALFDLDHTLLSGDSDELWCCTGRPTGVLNMREGKVVRLRAWLAEQGLPPSALADAVFYTDSANDLPLLHAVGEPVLVDPDASLRHHADATGWPVIHLAR